MSRKRQKRRGGSLLGGIAALVFGLALTTPASAQTQPASPLPDAPSHSQESQPCVKKACPAPPEVVDPPKPRGAAVVLDPLQKLGGEVEHVLKQEAPCDPRQAPCRLTSHQKLQLFVRRTYSPYTFASSAFDAAYSQATGDNYGPGMAGFGKRYGANLADGEARSFFQTYLLSSLLKQDPRYHRLGSGGFFYRAAYAASRVAVGRHDDGHPVFNTPEFAGTVLTVALGNAYYPERDTGGLETLNRAVGGIWSDATTNLLREFWPDIHRFFRKHEPESMQKMEKKIPGGNPQPPAAPEKAAPKE